MPFAGDMLVMVLLAGALAPAGLWMVWTARRRRAGVGPHCAACDYVLDGLPDGTPRCPECGADLARPGAVAIGRRRRDAGRLMAGVGLLLPALVVGGLYAARVLRPAKQAVVAKVTATTRPAPRTFITMADTTTRPSPLQITRATPPPYAGLGDDDLAAALVGKPEPAEADLRLLLAEVTRRAKQIEATQSGYVATPWIARIVDAALERHADPNQTWPEYWATFVESLRSTRQLGHDKWQRYLRQGVRIDVTFRKNVHIGPPFPMRYSTTVRLSRELTQRLRCRPVSLSIGQLTNDQLVRHTPVSPDQFTTRDSHIGLFIPQEQWKLVEPGPTTARLTVLISQEGYSNSDWIERIDRPITILPRSTERRVYMSELDPQVAQSLRLSADKESVQPDGLRYDGKRITLALTCVDAPTDIYAQVTIGVGTTGHMAGYAMWRKGETATRNFTYGRDLFAKARSGLPVNVTLIGSPEAAASTLEEGFTWEGTVRFANATIIDASPLAPPVGDELEKVEVHIPYESGGRLRSAGPYPLQRPATQPTTQPATGPTTAP